MSELLVIDNQPNVWYSLQHSPIALDYHVSVIDRPTPATQYNRPATLDVQKTAPAPEDDETIHHAIAKFVRDTLAEKQKTSRSVRTRGDVYHEVQTIVDRILLREVLDYAKGRQIDAARLLGISRTTLRSKLHSLGLTIEKQVGDLQG